ncbi:MAG: Hsp20/alpha crystallin family protein [Chitinophagaceae bacterium]|jgi:HSP20 family protein|nr:Hsp20/alpha crystallin family protein [Chitinophagaceae bacterium]
MTLVKHNFRNLDNIFDDLLGNIPASWGRDMNFSIPPVNIQETNDAYQLELVAPGLKKEAFKISLDKGVLSISYEHRQEEDTKDVKTHRKEFRSSSFKRSFTVDEKVNTEGIEAKYEDGILKLLLPKKEEVKVVPKEIAVQ